MGNVQGAATFRAKDGGGAEMSTDGGKTWAALGGGGAAESQDGSLIVTSPSPGVSDVSQNGVYQLVDTTGASDDAPALNSAITALAARGGGVIEMAAENHRWKSPVVVPYSGIWIKGAGRGATKVIIDDSGGPVGDAITFQNTNGCSITDLRISAASPRTAGNAIVASGGDPTMPIVAGLPQHSNGIRIARVDMDSQFKGMTLQDSPGPPLLSMWTCYVEDCRLFDFNGGDFFTLNASDGSSHFINRLYCTQPDVSSLTPGAGIVLSGSGESHWSQCVTYGTQDGILVQPVSGGIVYASDFTQCVFDTAWRHCGFVNVGPVRRTFGDLSFARCWFGNATNYGCIVNDVGVSMVSFERCTFIRNGFYGLAVASCSQVDAGNSTFAANTQGGFLATGNASAFSVHGSRFLSTNGIVSATQPVGVQINAGCNNFMIFGNDLRDNTTPIIDNTVGATKVVANNLP